MSEAKKSGLRDVIELVTKAEELIKDYCRELKLLNQWQLLMVKTIPGGAEVLHFFHGAMSTYWIHVA